MAVSWYAASSLRSFFLDQTQIDLKTSGQLLENQIGPHLAPLDTRTIDSICKKIGRLTATRFTVILASGEVVGDTDQDPQNMDNHRNRPEVLQAMKQDLGSSIRYSRTLRKKMMYVAIPLKKEDRIAAFIRTSLSISVIDDAMKELLFRIAWGGLIFILFAALFSYAASRYIIRPIEQLRRGAEQFARGDLKFRLPSMAIEELSSLSASLNDMAAQLEEKINNFIQQRNELEAVLASMVEGVMAVDKDERIISVNRAAADMFESHPNKLAGRLIQEVVRNRDLHEFIAKALADATFAENDLSIQKNNLRMINAHCSPLRDSSGKQAGTLVVLNDVTRIKRLERIRQDFVANVSHEIRTPLTAIKGFVETLQRGAVDNHEDAERFLGIIAKHVERLNSIVDDLLCLSRIEEESDKREIKIKETAIKNVLQSAIQVCQVKADEKKISIELSCDRVLTAPIDSHLFEQAAVNLIDNAVKYSTDGSNIQITAAADQDEVVIHFQDHGIGIPQQHIDRLFERFYRVDKARSRNLGGTGLGLAIVKHIVQAHGGRITVKSAPGAGSTFSIYLPKN